MSNKQGPGTRALFIWVLSLYLLVLFFKATKRYNQFSDSIQSESHTYTSALSTADPNLPVAGIDNANLSDSTADFSSVQVGPMGPITIPRT